MSKEQTLFKLYKNNIKWNESNKSWYFSFYHNGDRIRKTSKLWIKSKKHLAEEALELTCETLSKNMTTTPKTLDDLFEEFMLYKTSRPNSKETDTRYYRLHIKPYLGYRKVIDIKISDLTRHRNKIINMKKDNGDFYDNATIVKINSILKQIFDYAENFDYVDKNYMRKMAPIKTNRPNSNFSRRFIDYKDVLKVMDELNEPKYRAALAISLYTFMRPSEIFALNIEDDLGDKLFINKSWDSITKTLGPPKNNTNRYVAIPDALRDELDKYYTTLTGYDLDLQTPLIGITGRQSKTSIDHAIQYAIKRANVPAFSWYDIRSTMITNMLKSGANPYVVAKNAGHSQAMTTDTYALVDIEEQKEIVENMYKNLK
ncbi:tyrosine-type recombinase/integrase [Erysipelothrix anatis]|uniref:tyrosine-type recombinase/integrase n=1 Tax=Erysipelothrix anatis TaxID=2683713 RepID=UPI001359F04E|nr:site-specific integrase [Erysipelothrix anatis]